VLGSPGASRADELEKALLKEAPKIVQFLQEKGYRNVGVLKFRVKKGDGPASAAAGTLNLDVARRLEVALLLANDPKKPLGVIAGASGIADTIPGANHLTAEGRKPLFRPGYALAWGEEKVAPDAFLTGTVEIAADFKRLTVGVLAFDKDGGPLTKVAVIDAACDADVMVSGGESFMVRGAFDQGHTEQFTAKIIDTAHRVKTGEAKNPWEDRTAPVQLDVVYDGKRVPVEVREGRAWVREPREGEKVEFVLRRLDDSKDRFAAALLVNGENTFYKERLPPEQCTKWVLDPGCGPLTVSGFKTGENKGEAFRVMSRAESKRNEMYYGADVGTITLVVFREKTWKEDPKLPTDEEEDLAAIHRGLLPEKPPANLGALKRQLRSDDNRGLIGSGETIKVETVKVKFNTAPTPVMALTITYYKPQ
jgi:hypothetical protein